MLTIKNLNKSFSSIHVLKDISMSLDLGKICAISGSNGCGKTTFLKCISGLTSFDSGDIEFKSNSNFLFLSDKVNVFGDLTMKENLTVLSRYHNQMIDLNKFNDSLEKLNIKNLSSLPLKFFSQGNLQRNKLLIAMNLKWDYLFVDEPFSNLDYHGIKAFKEIFTSFKSSGKSIIFSTHHIDESKSICDEMIDIKNSTLVRNVT
jgi:ABC-type multidrug transport system ATPase subunit|tara:strand:- start:493 stop:1104 length:612 start_codon:yes stop_codon:yes gene_type:complete